MGKTKSQAKKSKFFFNQLKLPGGIKKTNWHLKRIALQSFVINHAVASRQQKLTSKVENISSDLTFDLLN